MDQFGIVRLTAVRSGWARLNVVLTALLISFSCVAFAIYAVPQLRNGHNWGDDFGLYLHLADNIREGRP
jgi:hypothetical protein